MKLFKVDLKGNLKGKISNKLKLVCGMEVYHEHNMRSNITNIKANFSSFLRNPYDVNAVTVYKTFDADDRDMFSQLEMPEGQKLKTGYFVNSHSSSTGRVFIPTFKDFDNAAMVFFGRNIIKPYTSLSVGTNCLNERKVLKDRLDTFYSDNYVLHCSHCGQGLINITEDNIDRLINFILESELKELVECQGCKYTSKEDPKVRNILMHEYFHLKKGKADIVTCSKELHEKLIMNNRLSTFIQNESYIYQKQKGSDILVIPDGTSFDFIAHNEICRTDYTQGHIKYENGKLSVTTKLTEKLPFYKVEE
jgi:hypothetical protein